MSFSPHLFVLQGPMAGQNLPLHASELWVGREAAAPFQLALYKEVSRRHAHLFLVQGAWCVEDAGSTNGTFVNGLRIASPTLLREGDVLKMGDFQARFSSGASQSAALPPGSTQMSPPNPFPSTPQQPYPQQPYPQQPYPQQPYPQQPYPLAPQQTYPHQPVYQPVAPLKNAGTAILCSFFLVGGGQFYNGEVEKGLAMMGGSFLCAFLGFFTCGLTFGGCLIFWVWSLVDASQSAERINRKNNSQPF